MSMRLSLRLDLLKSMPYLPLSESFVGQDPTTQWQYSLHHKLFCPNACSECSTSQSYQEVITFNCIPLRVKGNLGFQSSPGQSSC